MTGFVVDASAMLAWCFEDERPKDSDRVLDRLMEGGMAAPAHWPLEIANILWQGERRRRITAADADAFVETVSELGIEIDLETAQRAWREARALTREHKLTSYDAAYLELALRLKATLVSKDADLLRAARRAGVPVLNLA
ncbi:MAG: hypothetical protein FD124_2994 [Alphaproteobacteria bacterium]|nr:MAG: hypothetical protein FD160_1436 [Caulobacteraceae bacterium]TPW03500.1 MAG: hypothetical protein FD124_2994 [Alphaproteobacteria bacterium]